MANMKCAKCGRALDVTGLKPGASITCACGNVTSVTAGSSRKVLFAIIAGVGVVLMCPCLGMLSAIAIPNFIKFQARSKQAECKMYLKGWYTAQKMYFQQHDAYSPVLTEVGFSPERGNRYAYLGGEGAVEERGAAQAVTPQGAVSVGVDTLRFANLRPLLMADLPQEVASQLGMSGQCPQCEITMACVGNVDNDETLDVWVVSTGELELRDEFGERPVPGLPVNVVNDVDD